MVATAQAVRRLWRTWLFLLLTFLRAERLHAIGTKPGGSLLLGLLRRVFRGGTVEVRGGAGKGLLVSSDWMPIEQIQGAGIVRGVIEPEVQEALRRHVRPGSTVFDIGANIGFYSLLGARLTGPAGKVFAFEPVPFNASAVRANAALNGFSNVCVVEAAVSDRSGSSILRLPTELGWSHLAETRESHPDTESEIPVTLLVLDDEIERGALPVPHVVKIDVEDAETAVLRGMTRTLQAHDVILICEMHASNWDVLRLADELSYAVVNLEGTEHPGAAGGVHVLMYPKRLDIGEAAASVEATDAA